MTTQIEQLIDESLAQARARVGQSDVVYGLLGTMRRVYGMIEEIAGPTTMPMLDGCLRNRIILRGLRLSPARSAPVKALPLPVAGPGAATAEIILSSATDTCLAAKPILGEDGDVFLLVFILIDRLFEQMGGVPEASAFLAHIRDEDEHMRIDRDAGVGAPAIMRH